MTSRCGRWSSAIIFACTYPKRSKLHQIAGDLGTSRDIHPVLEDKDEYTHHKKRNKDDLKRETLTIGTRMGMGKVR